MTTLKCTKCLKVKDIELFSRNSRSKTGRRSHCKSCMKKHHKTVSSKEVSLKDLQEVFTYDPQSGRITSNISSHNRIKGNLADIKINEGGYRLCSYSGKIYRAHRLAWALYYGKYPEGHIDHIDGNKTNNKIGNLRDVDQLENSKNRPRLKTNKSGVTGVYWNKNESKWHCSIGVNGKSLHLGYFDCLQEAAKVRKSAEIKYGFHINHGRD